MNFLKGGYSYCSPALYLVEVLGNIPWVWCQLIVCFPMNILVLSVLLHYIHGVKCTLEKESVPPAHCLLSCEYPCLLSSPALHLLKYLGNMLWLFLQLIVCFLMNTLVSSVHLHYIKMYS